MSHRGRAPHRGDEIASAGGRVGLEIVPDTITRPGSILFARPGENHGAISLRNTVCSGGS